MPLNAFKEGLGGLQRGHRRALGALFSPALALLRKSRAGLAKDSHYPHEVFTTGALKGDWKSGTLSMTMKTIELSVHLKGERVLTTLVSLPNLLCSCSATQEQSKACLVRIGVLGVVVSCSDPLCIIFRGSAGCWLLAAGC